MPLQWQNIELQISGVDQYTDSPHVVNGRCEVVENCRFKAPPTVARRNPFFEITNGTPDGPIETPIALIAHGDELLAAGTRHLYAYAETPDMWHDRGTVSDFHVRRHPLQFDQSRTLLSGASAQTGFCMVVGWGGAASTAQGVIIDLQRDTVVNSISLASAVLSGAMRPVAAGDSVVLVMQDGASSNFVYKVLDTSTDTWDFGTTYATLVLTKAANSAGVYDVVPLTGSSTDFLIAYKSSGGDGNHPTVVRCTVSGTTVTESAFYQAAEVVEDNVAVCGTVGEAVYAAWATTTPSTRYVVLNASTLAVTAGPSNVDAAAASERLALIRLNSTSALLLFEYPEVAPVYAHSRWHTISSAGSLSSVKSLSDWVPASKPWIANGSAFACVMYESDIQPTYAIVELTDQVLTLRDARWCGTFLRGSAAREDTIRMLPEVLINSTVSGDVFETIVSERSRLQFAGAGDSTVIRSDAGVVRITLDAASTKRHMSCPWGSGRFVAGSRPTYYDTQAAFEHGFATTPERIEMGAVGGGANTWSILPVYEYLDATGAVMRSAPGPVIALENKAVIPTFTLRETLLNSHGNLSGFKGVYSSVRLITYRTVVNPTEVPFVYYRSTVRGSSAVAGQTLAFDIGADSALILQEQLYTNDGILDNAGTPPCTFCHFHNGRIWLGGTEHPTVAWFSQPYVPNEEPRFNEALTLNIGVEITAYASIDETLLVFGESSIQVIVGDGPPAIGGLDLGFEVATVSTDVGCIDPKSVVTLPTGVMFQSKKGLYHISKSLEVVWLGQPVKDTVDTYGGTIRGAALLKEAPEAVWGMSRSDGSVRVVYNYIEDKWSVDTIEAEMTGLVCGQYQKAWRLIYCTQSPTIAVLAQRGNPALADDEFFQPVKLRTAPVKLNTLQGWQAIRSLMVMLRTDDNGFTGVEVKVDYDNEGTFAETHTWTGAQLSSLPRKQVRVPTAKHKCQSIQFELTQLNQSPEEGAGSQFEIVSLVAEGGFLPSTYKGMNMQGHAK